MSNVATVQEIYAAFGRGDVPAILAKLADDVDWEYGTDSASVPWLERRHGPAEVAKFFEALGAMEPQKFVPKELIDGGSVVVALIDVDFLVKATGKHIIEEDEIHLWRFGPDGKVRRFRHGADSHMHVLATKGG